MPLVVERMRPSSERMRLSLRWWMPPSWAQMAQMHPQAL